MSQTHFAPKTTEPIPATPVPATADVAIAPAPPAPDRRMADPATLHRATNGRLARAGHTLRQLQCRHGNTYVQRMIAATPPQPSPVWGGSRDPADETTVPPPSWGRAAAPFEQVQLKSGGKEPNRTGLPDTLKAGVEALSGLKLDAVRVHYNSPQPARLNALAYTQGKEIHVAPGQERHLAHEAWHVVQQMEGRVQPTLNVSGVAINDDELLEREASVSGIKASRTIADSDQGVTTLASQRSKLTFLAYSVQCVRPKHNKVKPNKKRDNKLNLYDFGSKQVTVYRVEHDDKPAILHALGERRVENNSNTAFEYLRKPNQNVKIGKDDGSLPKGMYWFSFGTPKRALFNYQQRLENQRDAYAPDPKNPDQNMLPPGKIPKLKSFKVTNDFAKWIQKNAVSESERVNFPGRPLNSDQNYAPNQFGLEVKHLKEMEKYMIEGSYMEYDAADLATLDRILGNSKSTSEHRRKKDETHKDLRSHRARGRRKAERAKLLLDKKRNSYPRENDRFEERDVDIDDGMQGHLPRPLPKLGELGLDNVLKELKELEELENLDLATTL